MAGRSINVTLPEDLFNAMHDFMVQEQIEKPAEAIRMMIRIALSADVNSGAQIAARARGWNEVRLWATTRLAQALMEMHRELQMSLMDGS